MGNSPERGLREDALAYYGCSHPAYAQADMCAATRLFQSSLDSTREQPRKRQRLREADAFSDDDSDQESEPSKYDGLGCNENRENMDPQCPTPWTGLKKNKVNRVCCEQMPPKSVQESVNKVNPVCCEQMPSKGVQESFSDCGTLAGVQDFKIQNQLSSVSHENAKEDCWSIHEDVEENDARSSPDGPTPTKGCQNTKVECHHTKDECLAALGTAEDVQNESSDACAQESLLRRGAMVLLQGLEAQPQMNGLRGLCLGKGKEDRWIIHMDSEEPGSFRNVRSRNLRVIGCGCTIACAYGQVGEEVLKSGDENTKQTSTCHEELEETSNESGSVMKSLLEDMVSLPQNQLMKRLMKAPPEELITVVSPEASAYILYAKDWRDSSGGA